jgi:hypothetical protein
MRLFNCYNTKRKLNTYINSVTHVSMLYYYPFHCTKSSVSSTSVSDGVCHQNVTRNYWEAVTATGYGMDNRGVGVKVPVGAQILFSVCCPDRLWSSPSSHLMGTWVSFLGVNGRGVKLTTHLNLCCGQETTAFTEYCLVS